MKLLSKSYKQMCIEWMHEKSLRNAELAHFQRPGFVRGIRRLCPPPPYPCRPAAQYQFETTDEFHQHPNSTQEL